MRLLIALALVASCSKGDTPPATDPTIEVHVPSPKVGANLTPAQLDQLVAQAERASAAKTSPTADIGDAPAGTLAVSISIETLGGIASVVLPRGAPLPTEHTETFSTAADNQTSVEINIVQGLRPLVKDNRSLGKFQLTGIPPAPRGIPQIDVRFAVDADGILSVQAHDRATGTQKQIKIQGAQASNDSKAIAQLIADAAMHRKADLDAQTLSEARVRVSNTTYATKNFAQSMREKLSPTLVKDLDAAIMQGEAVLAQKAAPLADVQRAMDQLTAATQKAGDYAFANAAPMK